MDDFAIVPRTAEQEHLALGDLDGHEPIAEHNFNRKKMLTLEQGIVKLQKTTRQQHEVVSHLESGMKSMISETDLRRAVGLAFQEFEHRLEDAFQDSNRKCLAMFSKRDDVIEIQGQIGKKSELVGIQYGDQEAVGPQAVYRHNGRVRISRA